MLLEFLAPTDSGSRVFFFLWLFVHWLTSRLILSVNLEPHFKGYCCDTEFTEWKQLGEVKEQCEAFLLARGWASFHFQV